MWSVKFQGENQLNTRGVVTELVSVYVEKKKTQNNRYFSESKSDVNIIASINNFWAFIYQIVCYGFTYVIHFCPQKLTRK